MSSYAGDVSPEQAWAILSEDKDAVLVDVRTHAEWSYVGLPTLDSLGKEPKRISWQIFPAMAVNDGFAAAVAEAGVPKDAPILLLCRSGVRSKAAAEKLTAEGYTKAMNIAGGFEGNPDPAGHRGTLSGWKVAGLPWRQG
jgi:rhodanese-related sulfurtransferase